MKSYMALDFVQNVSQQWVTPTCMAFELNLSCTEVVDLYIYVRIIHIIYRKEYIYYIIHMLYVMHTI